MKRLIGLTSMVWFFAAPVSAQIPSIPVPPCFGGAPATPNELAKVGSQGYLSYTVSTIVGFNICVTYVDVVANVSGIPGSSMKKEGVWTATAQKQVQAPRPDTYVAFGDHTLFWILPFPGGPWGIERLKSQSKSVDLDWQDEEVVCQSGGNGGVYYVYDPVTNSCVEFMGTPIVIDTTGDGYRLTSINNGVWFDIDADGQLDKVAWTHRDSDVAFLALDRNGNGEIDNGAELFGDHTPVGPTGGTASNGFEALRFSESLPADGYITDRDPDFAKLLLWIDRNHNGISEPEELQCAADAGVEGIGLAYRRTRREDRFGNEFRLAGKLTWADRRRPINIFDVWLKRQ